MAAPKGNRFWEARSTHGRKPIFGSPEELWDACIQYFQWVEDNPLFESKICSFQGENKIEEIPKMRAMTKQGLCLYIDIDPTTWEEYKVREDFTRICTRVESVIYQQKFTGASADLLNPSIIARDLGLKESSSVEHSGSVDINQLSDDELNSKLLALINESAGA